MKKLIFGCGYLGLRVARRWRDQGDDVAILTRSEANAGRLAAEGFSPVIGDVMRAETLQALPEADHVLYAVGFDRAAGYSKRDVYLTGLSHVLSGMVGRMERLFYISSSSVYGQSNGEWVDEESACDPQREGGEICLAAEELIRKFADVSGPARCAASILRLSGIYGPGRLLARMDALRAGAPLEGRAEAWLNLIHVDDAAAAVVACERHGQPGRSYLISDDRPVQRREYFEELARLLDAPAPGFTGTSTGTRTEGLNKRCDNRRAHEELHLELQFPTLLEGLPDALSGN